MLQSKSMKLVFPTVNLQAKQAYHSHSAALTQNFWNKNYFGIQRI